MSSSLLCQQQATHTPGARQGVTDSAIDLALVSQRLAPWALAETLPPHKSDLGSQLNNKAIGQDMPAISFNGEVTERTDSFGYVGILF